MSDDFMLNKTLGPRFTLDVAPFSVDTSVPLRSMLSVEVGIRGANLRPQGGYISRFEDGPPNAFIGNNNDIYVDMLTYDLYQKYSTTWTLIGNILGPGSPSPSKTILTKTGAYTLTNTEFTGNVTIKGNSVSAFTLTLNTGLTGIEPCDVFQYGSGQITISGTATIRYATGPKTRTQYSLITITPIGLDEYLISNDTAA